MHSLEQVQVLQQMGWQLEQVPELEQVLVQVQVQVQV